MTARPAIPYVPRLFGAADAAQYLSLSQTTLRTLDIPRKQKGGRYFYDRMDLDAWANDLPYEGDEANGW